MKVNFLVGLMILSFAMIYSILGFEYYTRTRALDQGLQQCLVKVDNQVHHIWTKECKQS